MSSTEIKPLAQYLLRVAEKIPNGLSGLKDAVSFAAFELNIYASNGVKTTTFNKALTFARTIPQVEDLNDDDFAGWMLHDREYLRYLP